MKRSFIFIFLIIFSSLFSFFSLSPIYAELHESILKPFENNDLVIIGKIIQVNSMLSENKTEYSIQIEKYLKGQTSFDMITAILDKTKPADFPNDPLDYYNKPFFEEKNQVLVYLKKEGGILQMSPYSFTIKKNAVAGPPNVITSTGPERHLITQGEEIIISGVIKKGYLYDLAESKKDSSFHLSILNEKEKQIESENLNLSPDGVYQFTFQNEDELQIPGRYSWEITYENGSMGGEFVIIPDWNQWSPLKQIKNGVALIDVQCRDDKIPVYKYDRLFVACVYEETGPELWTRGWSTSTERLLFPSDNVSHALCNNYDGKWHPEYEGCRGDNIADLQCSLMGGEFVDELKICYNGICPENRTYTLCMTNQDLIPQGEKDEK